jgi:hypothetical protein
LSKQPRGKGLFVRKTLVAFAAASLLLVAVVASASGSTGTASPASPSTRASAAPVKLGYYYGIECGRHSCGYYNESREAAKYYCGSVFHLPGYRTGYHADFRGYSLVCFKLQSQTNLIDFYVHEFKIVRSIHVSYDRFPQTCDNGWCIQGEWQNTSIVHGAFRNPNGVTADYKAEWFSS